MIQLRSILQVADNSGAKKLRVIQVYGGSKRRFGHVGDVVCASVIMAAPNSNLKRGAKVRAVIVRTVKEHRRLNGEYIKFDDNAAVVVEARSNPAPVGLGFLGQLHGIKIRVLARLLV
jgi:large subunit ribosomal protein L14